MFFGVLVQSLPFDQLIRLEYWQAISLPRRDSSVPRPSLLLELEHSHSFEDHRPRQSNELAYFFAHYGRLIIQIAGHDKE